MSKALPLTVSSKLASGVATSILAGTYANNTGITTEEAPILLSLEAAGTLGTEQLAKQMPITGGQGTEAQARLIINAMYAALMGLVETYGAITVNTPFGTIETFVNGSIAAAHDTLDPLVNYAWLGIVLPEDVRKKFAEIDVYVPTTACPAAIKRIRNKDTNLSEIRGNGVFYVEGHDLSVGGTGEKIELLNALTRAKVCDVEFDAQKKSSINIPCHIPSTASVPVGRYILALTTLAGATAGTLWPLEIAVDVTQAAYPPPATVTITKCSGDGDSDGMWTGSGGLYAEGTGFSPVVTGDCASVSYKDAESQSHTVEMPVTLDGQRLKVAIDTLEPTVAADLNVTYKLHGGVAGSPVQTIVKSITVV